MHKFLCLAAAGVALGMAGATQADSVIYDSTGSPRFDPVANPTTPLRYQVNTALPAHPAPDPSRILFDDIPVFVGDYVGASVNVSKVEVDIVQKLGAPATTVDLYSAPMVFDALNNGGPNDDPGVATLRGLGAINGNPPGNGGNSTVLQNGDIITHITYLTNFNTGILNDTEVPGDPRQFFNLGLQFGNPSDQNGWEVADNLDNLDLLWDYKAANNLSEFTFNLDGNGDPIAGVMAVKVTGTLVPEPSMIGLALGTGSFLLSRRGRRA